MSAQPSLPIEGRAAAFAAFAHQQQVRKYGGEPYIVHPASVAALVRGMVTVEGRCAAWLHDTVEDCGISLDEIEERFGGRVRKIVSGLTSWTKHPDAHPSERVGNRAERKARDLTWLAMQDAEVQTIKVADLIDNSVSIIACDPEFAAVYLPEKKALLDAMDKAYFALRHRANEIVCVGLLNLRDKGLLK